MAAIGDMRPTLPPAPQVRNILIYGGDSMTVCYHLLWTTPWYIAKAYNYSLLQVRDALDRHVSAARRQQQQQQQIVGTDGGTGMPVDNEDDERGRNRRGSGGWRGRHGRLPLPHHWRDASVWQSSKRLS